MKASNGDIIAFFDDDAVADREWMKTLAAEYSDPSVIGAGGRIDPLWLHPEPSWYPKEFYWVMGCTYKGHPTEKCEIRNTFGSNISFRKEAFEKVGYFSDDMGRVDDKASTAEEMELCLAHLVLRGEAAARSGREPGCPRALQPGRRQGESESLASRASDSLIQVPRCRT